MSKRILIVEDQEDLRGVLRDLLSGSGYAVIEAVDGQDGVTKAKSERPDLVLMDIQLPVTSPGCSRARPSALASRTARQRQHSLPRPSASASARCTGSSGSFCGVPVEPLFESIWS